MPFAQSAIVFANYVFPVGFMLATRQQDSVISERKLARLRGMATPTASEGSKIITLTGSIGGSGSVDSSGNLLLNRDQAEAEANLLYSNLQAGYQKLRVGASDSRYIMAQKTKMTTTYEEGFNQSILELQIEFRAQDPRWLALNGSQLNGSGTAQSNGSVETWPVFTIAGPCVNPTIQVTPAGAPGAIALAFTVSMADADRLVVDCNPYNRANAVKWNGATVDPTGTPYLQLINVLGCSNNAAGDDFFPFFTPGSNLVTLPTSGSSVTWQDAYGF